MDRVVIVGAGQAGYQVAASLRDGGFTGTVTLLNGETGLPYQKPPLSKAYMHGQVETTGLQIRQAAFYADKDIEVRNPVWAVHIDRASRTLRLSDGTEQAYDHLVLATGTRNRPLPVPGADLPGVFYLRSLEDAQALRARLGQAKTAVVIGGGFIGLEFASVARAIGRTVTVVEAGARLMARAVAPETSAFYKALHERWGTQFCMASSVAAIEADGDGTVVALTDGRRLPADLVLIGIGVVPNSELAEKAGLAVREGIVVDEFLVTADPAISAIGDCASHPNEFAGGAPTLRIESIQNATDQARCVAARLLGKAKPYRYVPWFWSDQGDCQLQIVGLPAQNTLQVVRGEIAEGAFSVFRFAGDRLAAVDSVNRPAEHMAARKLLQNRVALTPDQAKSPEFDLKSVR